MTEQPLVTLFSAAKDVVPTPDGVDLLVGKLSSDDLMPALTGIPARLSIAVPVVAASVCIAFVVLLLPTLRVVAVDEPNERSSHVLPTPRGGGLGVIAGLLAGVGVAALMGEPSVGWILVGIVTMTVLGLGDDIRNLSVRARLLTTILISLVVSAAIIEPDDASTWVLSAGVAVFLSGYTNSFNFMDGINGISSMNCVFIAGWLTFLLQHDRFNGGVPIGLALAGSSLAFLPFNAPRAIVFLGDSGSYGIGFALAALAAWTWQSGSPLLLVLAPMTVYIFDTFTTFVRRIARRKSGFEAHREHVYQRLVDVGLPHLGSATIVLAATALASLAAWIARDTSELITLVSWAALGTFYIFLPRLVQHCGAKGSS